MEEIFSVRSIGRILQENCFQLVKVPLTSVITRLIRIKYSQSHHKPDASYVLFFIGASKTLIKLIAK
jgi:hypothetical protein